MASGFRVLSWTRGRGRKIKKIWNKKGEKLVRRIKPGKIGHCSEKKKNDFVPAEKWAKKKTKQDPRQNE